MRITKEEQTWVKMNKDILLGLLEKRKSDYIDALVEETDPQKSEVIKMWIKEFKSVMITIKNISELKSKRKKKNAPPFTGV